MRQQPIKVMTVGGGMRVAVEPVDSSQVASIIWMIPAGSAGDPVGDLGAGEATVLHDTIMRGAGEYTSREFSDALDRLGVQRATSVSGYHITLSAACLAESLEETLRLLALVVTQPRLEEDALDASRELALQSLRSVKDDAHSYVMIKAAEIALPKPFNLSGMGTEAGLSSLTTSSIHAAWMRRARPQGSILGIAGKVDPAMIKDVLEASLEEWRGASIEPTEQAPPIRGSVHEHLATAQTNMTMVFDAPKETDPTRLDHQLVVRVLGGGGMSNRMFTEVREKRGLCYSVGMAYSAGRDRGVMQAYAGSTHEKAGLTLACIREEMAKMAQGMTKEEFDRGVIGMKSGIVMNGESTHARAGALAGDLFRRGGVRSLDEIAAAVDALSLKAVNEQAAISFAPEALLKSSLAVVGPVPL
ncbi:MAG: insulinase family protein [Phycisphaerales bacterium]|nr:insulinase family protein [Phycisphaerales bacterium]